MRSVPSSPLRRPFAAPLAAPLASSLASSLVGPFADRLLRLDLAGLAPDRRRQVIAFTTRRVEGLPSFMRIGVLAIAAVVRPVLVVPGSAPVVRVLARTHLPLVGEYVRLVRSLGYAFIWETWPDTRPDGSQP